LITPLRADRPLIHFISYAPPRRCRLRHAIAAIEGLPPAWPIDAFRRRNIGFAVIFAHFFAAGRFFDYAGRQRRSMIFRLPEASPPVFACADASDYLLPTAPRCLRAEAQL
jgi:hypothetical protein